MNIEVFLHSTIALLILVDNCPVVLERARAKWFQANLSIL